MVGVVGDLGTVVLGLKCAHSWNQVQTLKNIFCFHIYCVHVFTHVHRTVTASRVVSNRESWYPPLEEPFRRGGSNIYGHMWHVVSQLT